MQVLRGLTDIAWAAFDADWYLAAYPTVHDALEDSSADAVLYFYLRQGRRLGHSPNIFFDEGWYIRAYPDAAAAIRRGDVASGFDHYCRIGFVERSPHWLFDEALYRRNYPQLTQEALQSADLVNGYDHYLRHGAREDRIGHWLFDPAVYRDQLDSDAAHQAAATEPFRHYLERSTRRQPEVPTSPYFDPNWYLERYPAVAEAIADGQWQNALHHYLGNETPTEFDPLPEFSEAYYLGRHRDVADAVAAGEIRNGYRHFLDRGRFALNPPRAGIDLRYYVSVPSVRDDLRETRAPDAFTHYLTIGRGRGLSPALPPEEAVSEAQGRVLFRRKAENLLPLFARMPMSFAYADPPAISVVLSVHNPLAATLTALGALRHAYPDPLELIMVNAGGDGKTAQIERFVQGAWLLRLDVEIGTARSRNAGLHNASAAAVLFLGNEVELAPGALAAALRRLNSDAKIAAVGGRVIAGDGRLREAGGIIERDGAVTAYCSGGSPLAPEVNFVRAADFCSSSFLLVRTAVVAELDGFDAEFMTIRYADADLGARIAASGHRVVYDPDVTAYDYSPGEIDAVAAESDRDSFARKHASWLATRSPAARNRLLFIESMVPSRMLGSGFVRSNDILKTIASLGGAVTVFPLRSCGFDLASLYRDLPDTVEVMHDRTIDDLPGFLAARGGDFDAVWVCRTHNLDDIAGVLDSFTDGGARLRIILDTEAVAAVRDAERAALLNPEQRFDFAAAMAQEFANRRLCHSAIAVNPDEAEHLRALGLRNVHVVGHTRAVTPTPRPFEEREGLLFVGAIREMDSPNYDALFWFADEVLPHVEAALGWETRLTVAGDLGDDVSLERFRNHPRITLRGMVPDLAPLYDSHRLFIAPTRYGAGIPYKLYEAASFGLPIVATELLCRQMGWENGRDIVAVTHTDPVRFAETLVALYRDEQRWRTLRDNALERLRIANSLEAYAEAVRAVLDSTTTAPRLRLAASD
jgi:glycosyltransferase involved in cell wall biosynthesis